VSLFITISRDFVQLSVNAVQNTDTAVIRSALTPTSQTRIPFTFISYAVLYAGKTSKSVLVAGFTSPHFPVIAVSYGL